MSAVSTRHEEHAASRNPVHAAASVHDLELRLTRLENRATDAITSMDIGMKLAQDIRRFIHCIDAFAAKRALRASEDLRSYCHDSEVAALSVIKEATTCARWRIDNCMGTSGSVSEASTQLRGALWCLNVAMRDLKSFSSG